MQSGTYQVSQTCNFCPPSPDPRARAPVFKPPREPFSIYGGEETMRFFNDDIPKFTQADLSTV